MPLNRDGASKGAPRSRRAITRNGHRGAFTGDFGNACHLGMNRTRERCGRDHCPPRRGLLVSSDFTDFCDGAVIV